MSSASGSSACLANARAIGTSLSATCPGRLRDEGIPPPPAVSDIAGSGDLRYGHAMTTPPVEDVIELQQLLARYAAGMTKNDIDVVLDVFTPDGTYSAFGDTYGLADFPALVDAAPKGLFLVGPPVLRVDGDMGSGEQSLCFVDQTNHDM